MPSTFLLNSSVVPCAGLWDVQSVSLDLAKIYADRPSLTSAIGHESTAALLSQLLERDVPVNRIVVTPVEGDILLCFKLKQRAPEGKILTVTELEELGYGFFTMELISPSKNKFWDKAQAAARESDLWESRINRTPSRGFLGGHRD